VPHRVLDERPAGAAGGHGAPLSGPRGRAPQLTCRRPAEAHLLDVQIALRQFDFLGPARPTSAVSPMATRKQLGQVLEHAPRPWPGRGGPGSAAVLSVFEEKVRPDAATCSSARRAVVFRRRQGRPWARRRSHSKIAAAIAAPDSAGPGTEQGPEARAPTYPEAGRRPSLRSGPGRPGAPRGDRRRPLRRPPARHRAGAFSAPHRQQPHQHARQGDGSSPAATRAEPDRKARCREDQARSP